MPAFPAAAGSATGVPLPARASARPPLKPEVSAAAPMAPKGGKSAVALKEEREGREERGEEDDPRRRKNVTFPWWQELTAVIITALAISALVRTFLIQPFFIPSPSMEDTLQINDTILVNKSVPRNFDLHRGDIVVFKDKENWLSSETEGAGEKKERNIIVKYVMRGLVFLGLAPEDSTGYLIKRVIGMPGDAVQCCTEDGLITVNDKAIEETYLKKGSDNTSLPFNVVVPAGHIWVMGDNRNHSADSRSHQDSPSRGFVALKDVVGRAFVTVWPMERMRALPTNCAFYNVPPPKETASESVSTGVTTSGE